MYLTNILLCIAATINLVTGSGFPFANSPFLLKQHVSIMNFPDGNGNLKPSIIYEGILNVPPPPIDPEKNVTFMCYTRTGTSQVYVGNKTSLQSCSFNSNLPTIFITHGYRDSADSTTVQGSKKMYLEVKDCNIVTVDWSGIADNILYNVVKEQTIEVGAYVGKLIDFMASDASMNLKNVHLSGHSLGAHVMGIAGKNVKSGKVARITGLDPARPLYTIENTENRLAAGDAEFVDAIHACGGLLSFEEPIGDADFFPNGGKPPQPGCGSDIFGACSHSRAWQLFAESIGSDDFKAVACGSYDEFLSGKCDLSPKTSMGEPTPSNARGTFYLNTSDSPPYALG